MNTLLTCLLGLLLAFSAYRNYRLRQEWLTARAEQRRLHVALFQTLPSLRFAIRAAATRSRVNPHYRDDLQQHEAALQATLTALTPCELLDISSSSSPSAS